MSVIYVQATIPGREVDGEMAVITARSSEIHRLNPVATEIWKKCAKPGADMEQIVAHIVHAFDVERDQAAHDVEEFVAAAIEKSILIAH